MNASYRQVEGPRFELDESSSLYPSFLREMAGRPARIYGIGNPQGLAVPSVSIVGARKATPYGIACAELAAQCAAALGVGVVSGAAIGCDQAAQHEALRQGAVVCAVLGSGANVVYPPSSAEMLNDIVATGGAVVSLLPWNAPPNRWAFVKRNAIIAALSKALVICEAGMPSGTFSTAQHASDAGREILVFPGSIFSPNSTGSNYLIANNPDAIPLWDRACLEVAFSRIYGRLRSVGLQEEKWSQPYGSDDDGILLEALRASPSTPGELVKSYDGDLPQLMRKLSRLEFAGRLVRLADGRYCLSKEELKRGEG